MSKLTKIVAAAIGGLVLAAALVATQADALTPRHDGGCCAGGPRGVVVTPYQINPHQPGPDPAYTHRAAGHRR
jgi:hypothetical protein